MNWIGEQLTNTNHDLRLQRLFIQQEDCLWHKNTLRKTAQLSKILKLKNLRYRKDIKKRKSPEYTLQKILSQDIRLIRLQQSINGNKVRPSSQVECQQLEEASFKENASISSTFSHQQAKNLRFINTEVTRINQNIQGQSTSIKSFQTSLKRYLLSEVPKQDNRLRFLTSEMKIIQEYHFLSQRTNQQRHSSQNRHNKYKEIIVLSQVTDEYDLKLLSIKATPIKQRDIHHQVIKKVFKENEKRAELFENDIWQNILEKFKQTYNDRYYNLKGNILGQILDQLAYLNLQKGQNQESMQQKIKICIKKQLKVCQKYLQFYSPEMTMVERSFKQEFYRAFAQDNQKSIHNLNLLVILNITRGQSFIERVIFRIIGLYLLLNKEIMNQSFNIFKHEIRNSLYLHIQDIRYFIYLFDFEEVIQIGISAMMSKDQYLHLLIFMENFPFFIKDHQSRTTLLNKKLLQHATELILQRNSTYIYYLLLASQNSIDSVRDFIVSNKIYDSFDWSEMKKYMKGQRYNQLVEEVLYLQAKEGKVTQAIEILGTLMDTIQEICKIVLKWLPDIKKYIQSSQRIEIYSHLYDSLIKSKTKTAQNQSYTLITECLIKISTLDTYFKEGSLNKLINFMQKEQMALFEMDYFQLPQILHFLQDKQNIIYLQIMNEYLKGMMIYKEVMHDEQSIRYKTSYLKHFHTKLNQLYLNYNLSFEQHHQKLIEYFHLLQQ